MLTNAEDALATITDQSMQIAYSEWIDRLRLAAKDVLYAFRSWVSVYLRSV